MRYVPALAVREIAYIHCSTTYDIKITLRTFFLYFAAVLFYRRKHKFIRVRAQVLKCIHFVQMVYFFVFFFCVFLLCLDFCCCYFFFVFFVVVFVVTLFLCNRNFEIIKLVLWLRKWNLRCCCCCFFLFPFSNKNKTCAYFWLWHNSL